MKNVDVSKITDNLGIGIEALATKITPYAKQIGFGFAALVVIGMVSAFSTKEEVTVTDPDVIIASHYRAGCLGSYQAANDFMERGGAEAQITALTAFIERDVNLGAITHNIANEISETAYTKVMSMLNNDKSLAYKSGVLIGIQGACELYLN